MKTLVVYMPAFHGGYAKMIDKLKPSSIYVIDNELASGLVTPLERDLRALPAGDVVSLLSALYPKIHVSVLHRETLVSLKKSTRVYMPNEDISHELADKYLPGVEVKYINTFLRWDMRAVDKSLKLQFSHPTSKSPADRKFMDQAIELSHDSPDWWRQIGALLVKNKKVILTAYNRPYPDKDYSINVLGDPKGNFGPGEKIELSKFIHAEAVLISEAARQGIATEGCNLYVTVFPCPVCAKLVANAGIKSIFYKDGYSMLDAEDIAKAKKIKLIRVI